MRSFLDNLTTFDKRARTKGDEKSIDWNLWGKDFMVWILSRLEEPEASIDYRLLFFEGSRYISRKTLHTAFKIVLDYSRLWEFRLRHFLEPQQIDKVENVLWDVKQAIATMDTVVLLETGEIEVSEGRWQEIPFDSTTVVGILHWHFRYFFGHGEIWRLLTTILDRKREAMKKALQRAGYGHYDYLLEYKRELGLYTMWTSIADIKNMGRQGAIDKCVHWCQEQRQKLWKH